MKNTKFKLMAAVLCLTVGFAFAGCNAATEETTKEETTTTTTEATTTTTEEETTTTEEETEVSLDEDDMGFEMPDTAAAEDFEVEGVAAAAQECLDAGMELYAIPADQLDAEVDEDTYIEGFMGMGGSMSVHVDTEADESSADADGFTMVQCAAFTTYEDALAYANTMLDSAAEEDGIEFEKEETDDGLTFSGEVEYEDMEGSMTVDGYVTPEGVFYFEAVISM